MPLNNGTGNTANSVALVKRGAQPYAVLTDVVSDSGVAEGAEVLIEETASAIAAAKDGDVVLVRIGPAAKHSVEPERRLLRVLVRPALLVTNREKANQVVRTDDPGLKIEICGVVLR